MNLTSRSLLLLLFILCGLLAVSSCVQRKPERLARKESPVSAQLAEMVTEQERFMADSLVPLERRENILKTFRETTYSLIAQALIREPVDLYRAALILQSADQSAGPECCLLAHYLAANAAEKGYDQARHLAAVCLDRYLVFSGQPQKYGTQHFNDSLGRPCLAPLDTLTTDSERVVWDVLPLEQLKARLEGQTP